MLEETLGYYKSQLKSAAKSGPQYVTIESVEIPPLGNAWTIKYKNDNIEHDEYHSARCNYGDFIKLLSLLKSDISELVGRQLWIVIRHNILLDNKQNEIKRESEIVHYSVDEQMPNYPTILEQYEQF